MQLSRAVAWRGAVRDGEDSLGRDGLRVVAGVILGIGCVIVVFPGVASRPGTRKEGTMIATLIGVAAVLVVVLPRLSGVRAGIRALTGLIAEGIKSQRDLARANAAEVRTIKRQGGELTMNRLVVSLALAALALTGCGSGNSGAGSGSWPAGGSSSSSRSYWWNAG